LAKNAIVYTTRREEEFSPVKNAQGDDSPATSKRDQVRRAAEWLEIAGVEVERVNSEPGSVLEISPLFATSVEQLKERKLPFTEIKAGKKLYFDESGPQEV
jgi:UDP-N-acetylglucosamine/UDP-N-acetylgalactosamine diphosphorylase